MDLRRRRNPPRPPHTPISIKGKTVEKVGTYKYLGVHLNDRLDWSDNTVALYKKGQSRLFFLRRLRSFNVCKRLLTRFYHAAVASVLFFSVAVWGGGLKNADKDKINKIVKKANSVVGGGLDGLAEVAERRRSSKLRSIMDNPSHPLFQELSARKSVFSQRLTLPQIKTDRFGGSFVPAAIKGFNRQL